MTGRQASENQTGKALGSNDKQAGEKMTDTKDRQRRFHIPMIDVPEERKEQIEQKKKFKDKIEENFPEIKALNMFL